MTWLERLLIARAANPYARRLPARLKEGWGGSEHYTPAQIQASVEKLRLDARFIALCYAAFLPKEDFERLKPEMRVVLDYEDARAIFGRWRSGDASAFDPPPVSSYITGGR